MIKILLEECLPHNIEQIKVYLANYRAIKIYF